MDSGRAAHALTPESVAALADAAGIPVEPERLPAVAAVLAELFELEREIGRVDVVLPGEDRHATGGLT